MGEKPHVVNGAPCHECGTVLPRDELYAHPEDNSKPICVGCRVEMTKGMITAEGCQQDEECFALWTGNYCRGCGTVNPETWVSTPDMKDGEGACLDCLRKAIIG